jgi:hypothetical protein
VESEAVELDNQALRAPEQVHLVALDEDVRFGLGEASLAQFPKQPPLRTRACPLWFALAVHQRSDSCDAAAVAVKGE